MFESPGAKISRIPMHAPQNSIIPNKEMNKALGRGFSNPTVRKNKKFAAVANTNPSSEVNSLKVGV